MMQVGKWNIMEIKNMQPQVKHSERADAVDGIILMFCSVRETRLVLQRTAGKKFEFITPVFDEAVEDILIYYCLPVRTFMTLQVLTENKELLS